VLLCELGPSLSKCSEVAGRARSLAGAELAIGSLLQREPASAYSHEPSLGRAAAKRPSSSTHHHSSSSLRPFFILLMPAGHHSFGYALALLSLFDYLHILTVFTSLFFYCAFTPSPSLIIGFDCSARVHQSTSRHTRPTPPPQHVLISSPRRLAKHSRTRSEIFTAAIAVDKHISYPKAASRALKLANQSTLWANHPHSPRSRP
jgi:hypothetical protein